MIVSVFAPLELVNCSTHWQEDTGKSEELHKRLCGPKSRLCRTHLFTDLT
jgi:hypothetical protein